MSKDDVIHKSIVVNLKLILIELQKHNIFALFKKTQSNLLLVVPKTQTMNVYINMI